MTIDSYTKFYDAHNTFSILDYVVSLACRTLTLLVASLTELQCCTCEPPSLLLGNSTAFHANIEHTTITKSDDEMRIVKE